MPRDAFRLSTDRAIGAGQPTLVIAEIGQNHNGRRDWAEQLVDVAAWAGADAVKMVKRDLASELTAAAAARVYDSPHSFGHTYGEHRRVLELSLDDHAAVAERARRLGLHFICTVCDIPSAAALHAVGVDAFKIASRDLGNGPLINFVAGLGRPVILSTGMSAWDEIDAAAAVCETAGIDWAVLQCTSLYPAPDTEVHLRTLSTLAKRYGTVVGFSDHTLGTTISPAAVALGAAIVEKHITLDRAAKGSDHACSAEPEDLRQLVENIRRVEAALGCSDKTPVVSIQPTRTKLGRSLVTRMPLAAGTIVDESMLVLKSPGDGVAWKDRAAIVGRRLRHDLAADTTLACNDVA